MIITTRISYYEESDGAGKKEVNKIFKDGDTRGNLRDLRNELSKLEMNIPMIPRKLIKAELIIGHDRVSVRDSDELRAVTNAIYYVMWKIANEF